MTLHKARVTQTWPGPLTLWLDGEKNPITIADEPVQLEVGRGDVPLLRVAIMCSDLSMEVTDGFSGSGDPVQAVP